LYHLLKQDTYYYQLMGFITEEGLVQLKNYKYVSGGYSWLDNKINPFWVGCVELIPLVMNNYHIYLVGCSQHVNFHRIRVHDHQLRHFDHF
jgi:hypothetical protein